VVDGRAVSGSPVLSTAVYRPLGNRNRRFELRLGEMREIERLTGSGILAVWRRMATLESKIDDLRETIRLGLIGGGAEHAEAEAIVLYSVDGRPINMFFDLAVSIMKAAFEGVEPVGKTNGAESSGAPETFAPSTNSAAPQDSAPAK
jgi:hypothetical protein